MAQLDPFPIMSSEAKPRLTPGAIPLMEPVRFYSAFRTASSKREKLEQLERALSLFVEVLQKHEIDEGLKVAKIQEINDLKVLVIEARLAHLKGGKSEDLLALQKSYQQTIKHYVGTTTQLQTFEDRFRQLWEDPVTPVNASAVENIYDHTSLSPDAHPSQAKDSVVTAASKKVRKVFSIALAKTLLAKPRSNTPLVTSQANEEEVFKNSVDQDLQTFNEIAAQLINADPEIRQSLEQDRQYNLSVPRPGMKPFEYPERSTLEEEGSDATAPYNRSTFIGQPAKKARLGVMGHVPVLGGLEEALRIVESDSGHQDPGPSHSAHSSVIYTAIPGGNQSGYKAGSSSVTADHDQVSVSSMHTDSSQSTYGGEEYKSWFHPSDNQ